MAGCGPAVTRGNGASLFYESRQMEISSARALRESAKYAIHTLTTRRCCPTAPCGCLGAKGTQVCKGMSCTKQAPRYPHACLATCHTLHLNMVHSAVPLATYDDTQVDHTRATSLMRNRLPVGLYSRAMLRVLGGVAISEIELSSLRG